VYFILFRGKNKRNGVLLVGLCDSGKTLLWSRVSCWAIAIVLQTTLQQHVFHADFSIKLVKGHLPQDKKARQFSLPQLQSSSSQLSQYRSPSPQIRYMYRFQAILDSPEPFVPDEIKG
jgi:hypothetical protein